MHREWPLEFDEPYWYLLRPFLEAGVADAQTIRAHGLLSADLEVRGVTDEHPVCFIPNNKIMWDARNYLVLSVLFGSLSKISKESQLFATFPHIIKSEVPVIRSFCP